MLHKKIALGEFIDYLCDEIIQIEELTLFAPARPEQHPRRLQPTNAYAKSGL
jgi:hypothetical protein